MKLSYRPFDLKLKHPFTIAGFSRTATPVMLVELTLDGITGTGEAAMVPYMGEDIKSATRFLEELELTELAWPFDFDKILSVMDDQAPGQPAIKAAIDIALHDLKGKLEGRPCYSYFGSDPAAMPATSVTIGMDTPDVIREKVHEAAAARVLKVKLGGGNDEQLIGAIRAVSDKPLYADANQGWSDRYEAVDKIAWLKEQGVVLIEQPMNKRDAEGNGWVARHSVLPVIADESVQRFADLERAAGHYHGVNIKLMKSAGMHEAGRMITKARALGLKVLVGCMSETSVATLAAAALAPLGDWADLDGPFLTGNNPFPDPGFKDGKWVLTSRPGLGLNF